MSQYLHFRAFLREQDCEEAFDRAFYSYNDCTSLDESLWEAGDEASFFAQAFDWRATPEGRAYWSAMDKKWYEISQQE